MDFSTAIKKVGGYIKYRWIITKCFSDDDEKEPILALLVKNGYNGVDMGGVWDYISYKEYKALPKNITKEDIKNVVRRTI